MVDYEDLKSFATYGNNWTTTIYVTKYDSTEDKEKGVLSSRYLDYNKGELLTDEIIALWWGANPLRGINKVDVNWGVINHSKKVTASVIWGDAVMEVWNNFLTAEPPYTPEQLQNMREALFLNTSHPLFNNIGGEVTLEQALKMKHEGLLEIQIIDNN